MRRWRWIRVELKRDLEADSYLNGLSELWVSESGWHSQKPNNHLSFLSPSIYFILFYFIYFSSLLFYFILFFSLLFMKWNDDDDAWNNGLESVKLLNQFTFYQLLFFFFTYYFCKLGYSFEFNPWLPSLTSI